MKRLGFSMIIWHPLHDEQPTIVLEADETLNLGGGRGVGGDQNGYQCCCLQDK